MGFLSARSRAGLSQAKLADAVGVTDAAVCQWEKGKQLPRASLLPKIAEALDCTVDELLAPDSPQVAQDINTRKEV